MKSYTDLEQSKKLEKILPLESADMCYIRDLLVGCKYGKYKPYIGDLTPAYYGQGKIRCWSLAALLSVLQEGIIEKYYAPNLQKENGKYSIAYGNDVLLCTADNPVDACVQMILKLHEQKLL